MSQTTSIPTFSLPTMPRVLIGKDAAILHAFDAYTTRHGSGGVVTLPTRFVMRLLATLDEWAASTCDAHTFYRMARILRATLEGYRSGLLTFRFTETVYGFDHDSVERYWTDGVIAYGTFDQMVHDDDEYLIQCREDKNPLDYDTIDTLRQSLGINPYNHYRFIPSN